MAAAFLDLSTGEFLATQFSGESAWQQVLEQLDCFNPREIVFPKSLEPLFRSGAKLDAEAGSVNDQESFRSGANQSALNALDEWFFSFDRARELLLTHFEVASLEGFGLGGRD